MDRNGSGSRSSYYSNAGDRRLEIVSGRSYGSSNSNATYLAKTRSPDPAPVPTHATRVSKQWSLNDSETKRKKRVASYKAYEVEGKVKATLRKGLRWIKKKCSKIVHGY